MTERPAIGSERVDDIPLLVAQMRRIMGDVVLPRHNVAFYVLLS